MDIGLWYGQKKGIIVLLQLLSNNKKAEKAVSKINKCWTLYWKWFKFIIRKLNAAFQSEDVENAYIFLRLCYLKIVIFQWTIIPLNLKI